jgi:hypothetical protein
MTTGQAIFVYTLAVIGAVGGIVGFIAFIRAERSLCHGSVTLTLVAEDDDLRPHPRYRHD